MSDISPINSASANRIGRAVPEAVSVPTRSTDTVRGRGGARPDDRVEFSRVAQYLSQLNTEPTERTDLIKSVRAEIQSGTYLTEDKLASAADGLLDDINFDL